MWSKMQLCGFFFPRETLKLYPTWKIEVSTIIISSESSLQLSIGTPPYDGVAIKVMATVHLAVTSTFIILACAGITLAIACLIFNFKYRKTKYTDNYYYRGKAFCIVI